MRRRHHVGLALGFLVGCSHVSVKPEARTHLPAEPGTIGPPVTTTEAPTTIATVSGLPPTTDGTTTTTVRPKPLPTTTLPEYADEAMSDVEWAIRSTFPETPDRAVRIARCESGLDPDALNGEHVGIMQIATKVHARLIAKLGYTVGDLFGIRANLHVARAIFDGADGGPRGWAAWTCAA